MWDEVLLFFVPFRSQFFMRSLFSGERQWPFGPLVGFSFGVGAFVIGLSQISSFFSHEQEE